MKKVETLIVAGCSHSFGAETFSEKQQTHPDSMQNAYGKFLSDKLKCAYKNISFCGISNLEISRKIQQFIDFNKIDPETTLIIIGWTDPNRFTFYPEGLLRSVETYFVSERYPYNFSAYLVDFAKVYPRLNKCLAFIKNIKFGNEFLSFFRKNIFKTEYYYDLNYMIRVFTSSYLQLKGIRHLTFSTLKENAYKNTFKYESILNNKYNILENKNKFDFYSAFKNLGIHAGGHLTVKGHQACAEYLYSELISRGIIETQ